MPVFTLQGLTNYSDGKAIMVIHFHGTYVEIAFNCGPVAVARRGDQTTHYIVEYAGGMVTEKDVKRYAFGPGDDDHATFEYKSRSIQEIEDEASRIIIEYTSFLFDKRMKQAING